MWVRLIDEFVDIFQYPTIHKQEEVNPELEITIGDLHANAILFLFMLVKHEVFLEFSKEDYAQCVEIYNTPTESLTKAHLQTFNHILANAKVNRDAPLIRLMGDEVADRGNNDYFILKIIEVLHSHQVRFEIMLSNHAMEFIQSFETQLLPAANAPIDFRPHLLFDVFSQSLSNMVKLINSHLIHINEVKVLYARCYIPHVKIASTTIHQNEHHVDIFTHAPVGYDQIASLAKMFNVIFDDRSPAKLGQSIEILNTAIFTILKKYRLHEFHSVENIHYIDKQLIDMNDTPFETMLWNRNTDTLLRPAEHEHGFTLNFVHGHTVTSDDEDHVFNLENILGKGSQSNQSFYKVLLTNYTEPQVLAFKISSRFTINFMSQLLEISQNIWELQAEKAIMNGQFMLELITYLMSISNNFFENPIEPVEFFELFNEAITPSHLSEIEQHPLLLKKVVSVLTDMKKLERCVHEKIQQTHGFFQPVKEQGDECSEVLSKLSL